MVIEGGVGSQIPVLSHPFFVRPHSYRDERLVV
jgi:hypothetical protein